MQYVTLGMPYCTCMSYAVDTATEAISNNLNEDPIKTVVEGEMAANVFEV